MNSTSKRKGTDPLGRVLVVERDSDRATRLGQRLQYLHYEPVIAHTQPDFDEFNAEPGIAAIVGSVASDKRLQTGLARLGRSLPGLPFLLIRDGAAESADCLGSPSHAVWKVDLPIRSSQFGRLLGRAARYAGAERRHRISGGSKPVIEVRKLIERVADFDTTVLITGDSGTGKELVARTIHDLSDRSDKPFVPINCGAIPAELLESELFGHKKGAFTSAFTDRVGRFGLAEGGTLFLDEIGDMALAMQRILLRVLQERCFERVGSNTTQACDVRITAATHCDLQAAVASGAFREDLYHRLNVFPIEMPCLRKRVSDLPLLFDELCVQHHGASQSRLRLSPRAMQALASYDWPGNIRELSNLVERLGIVKPSGDIQLGDLPAKIRETCRAPLSEPFEFTGADLKAHLQGVEQSLIKQAIAATGGVTAKAARLLGMQRTTLVEKLARNYA